MDFNWLAGRSFVCFIPTLLVVSWRWRMLLGVHGVHMRFWRVFELNMIGQFFSTFGVGTTGGDVFKIFYVARAVPENEGSGRLHGHRRPGHRPVGAAAFSASCFPSRKLPLLLSHRQYSDADDDLLLFCRGGRRGRLLVASLGPLFLGHRAIVALIDRLPFVASQPQAGRRHMSARPARFGTNILALLGLDSVAHVDHR